MDFQDLFDLQFDLMQALKIGEGDQSPADIYRADVLAACMGLASEAGEVLSEVNVLNRPWARKSVEDVKTALSEEAIDVLMFFIELMILLDMEPNDVKELYEWKVKVVLGRLKNSKS